MKRPSKKEILKNTPQRAWGDTSREYNRIWIIPTGTKHDSGYMHIAIVGVWDENHEEKREICGYPDDISTYFYPTKLSSDIYYQMVRMDCYYPSGILQYHSNRGVFKVSEALSSMDITFYPLDKTR